MLSYIMKRLGDFKKGSNMKPRIQTDIKAEDRKRKYSFSIDGKWIDIEVTDREIVRAVNCHEEILILLKQMQTAGVFKGEWANFVEEAIDKAEGKIL